LKKLNKIEFADQDIVDKFVPQLVELVDLYDLTIDECFISNESMIQDFNE